MRRESALAHLEDFLQENEPFLSVLLAQFFSPQLSLSKKPGSS